MQTNSTPPPRQFRLGSPSEIAGSFAGVIASAAEPRDESITLDLGLAVHNRLSTPGNAPQFLIQVAPKRCAELLRALRCYGESIAARPRATAPGSTHTHDLSA